MKKLTIGLTLITIVFLSSWYISKIKPIKTDYSKSKIIDSLIRATPQSVDTLFLGFTTDMNKLEYKKHIDKLRSEGKTLKYSSSFTYNSLNIGDGYSFETAISSERSSTKTVGGWGKYFLEPKYSVKTNNLFKLTILRNEKWDNRANYNWIKNNIKKKSEEFSDSYLKKALIRNQIISDRDFIRQRGNLIIYGDSRYVTYINKSSLLYDLLIKVRDRELTIEDAKKNKEIEF